MQVLDAGHSYWLAPLDGGLKQTLTFVKRQGEKYPFNHGSNPGTNCQEVLRALIDRTKYLNSQQPCAETESCIALLQTTLYLFEQRAAQIHGRDLDFVTLEQIASSPTCSKCGHIGCTGDEP